MRIIGVDNGLKGGLGFIDTDNSTRVYAVAMPTYTLESGKKKHEVMDSQEVKKEIQAFLPDLVVIEKAQSMPGQGVVGVGNYMRAFGIMEGICVGLGIPYRLVSPQTWKKALGLTYDKGKCIERCKQLFPSVDLTPKGCRKPHDGMAESLLLAYWGSK